MKKEIRDYLQNKEYNLLFERLLMLLKPHPGARSKVDLMDTAERDALYGNNAMSRVYNFSNEYLDGTFKGMDLTGKRAFVVGSSGDQALHCIQNGASEVTLVDGNMWTKPYVELKLAAIKNLEFEEFSSYMTYDQIFNHKFYSKVSHDLSPESQAFWDEIIMQFSGQSLEDISLAMNVKDEFFQHCSVYFDPDIGRKDNNYYVNKAGFNKLKKNLPNCKVDFKLADFEEFPDVADGQYDLIMLSNIFDYSLSTVFFSVLEGLNDNHLTEDGLIQAHYTFGEKEEGKRKFIERLENFTASRQGKNIRLDIRDVGANQGKVEKFFFKRKSAANIMLKKSDFGTYPELDGK